jgi:hypothetical protein
VEAKLENLVYALKKMLHECDKIKADKFAEKMRKSPHKVGALTRRKTLTFNVKSPP